MEENEFELVQDFREHFQMSFYDIGKSICYREALILITALEHKQGSYYHAKVNDWKWNMSKREELQIIHLNAFLQANNKKELKASELVPLAYPTQSTERIGDSMPLKDALDIFKAANPDLQYSL